MRLESSKRRSWVPEPEKPQDHNSEDAKFYRSRKWRSHRNKFIEQNPICTQCEQEGVAEPAKVADHITPIKDGGERWSFGNLQGLCLRHHAKKSARERRNIKRGMG